MNLTPREKDKLMIALAALVARGRLARGVKLNYPETVALITDFIMEGVRDGKSVAELRRFPAKNLPSIAPDVSSGSRRSRGHITPLCNRSDNAEAELTDKRDGKMISGNRLMSDSRKVLTRDQVMEGISEMIHEMQVEATFPDGTKLVSIHDPIPCRRFAITIAMRPVGK